MVVLLIYLLIMNVTGLVLMHADKLRSKNKQWRIPERTFLLIAAAGGSLGILFGIGMFRHKTRHLKFTIGVPAIIVMQILTAAAIVHFCS